MTNDTRTRKVILFVMGSLDDLKTEGEIEGGGFRLSASGKIEYEELKRSGFTPDDREIKETMDFLQNMPDPDELM